VAFLGCLRPRMAAHGAAAINADGGRGVKACREPGREPWTRGPDRATLSSGTEMPGLADPQRRALEALEGFPGGSPNSSLQNAAQARSKR